MIDSKKRLNYGFIGLGHQGTPMAERMIAAGLRPWLWARRSAVTERYHGLSAHVADSPARLGAECDVVGLCLYDAAATESVLFGNDGLMESIRPGSFLAMHATVGGEYVVDLAARLAKRGVTLIDAPVSGGPRAANGELLVIVGGDAAACAACLPMFETYSNCVINVGELGSAQAVKLLNNGLMAATIGLVFDVFALGEHLGVDVERLGEVLGQGSAACFSVDVWRAVRSSEALSIASYPTLHKDVELMKGLAAGSPIEQGTLVASAGATIDEMRRLRADYERRREVAD